MSWQSPLDFRRVDQTIAFTEKIAAALDNGEKCHRTMTDIQTKNCVSKLYWIRRSEVREPFSGIPDAQRILEIAFEKLVIEPLTRVDWVQPRQPFQRHCLSC